MSVKDLCEKMGFHPWEGWTDLEGEWLSANILQQIGTMEMESEDGAVLRVPVTVRIEFGNYDLDVSSQRPAGKVA